MIRYILLDIDDTLFPSTDFSTLARKNAIKAMISMGLKRDSKTLSTKLAAIIEKKGSNYPRHFDELCKELKIKNPGRYIAAAVAAYHNTKTSIQPFPTVPFTLLKLKQKGHKLYVATNGSSIKQWDKLIRLRIALYFDGVFVSEEIGQKKSISFYRKILSKLGAKPQECMMVGDREDADIAPAKNVGIRTVRMLSGKYAKVPSSADFTIRNMDELIKILEGL
jgi:putative hydrolase of the HAD superfamily